MRIRIKSRAGSGSENVSNDSDPDPIKNIKKEENKTQLRTKILLDSGIDLNLHDYLLKSDGSVK